MFTHNPVEIPELSTKNVNRKRFYLTPEGKLYPSITTVLQRRKMEGLMEWRKKVGDDVANYVARKSATRGTQVHHFCEKYLDNGYENEDWNEYKKGRFLSYCMFSQLRPHLDKHIGLVHCQEQALWHNYYKIAGRKTIIYRLLHMQKCIKKEHYKKYNRLLF